MNFRFEATGITVAKIQALGFNIGNMFWYSCWRFIRYYDRVIHVHGLHSPKVMWHYCREHESMLKTRNSLMLLGQVVWTKVMSGNSQVSLEYVDDKNTQANFSSLLCTLRQISSEIRKGTSPLGSWTCPSKDRAWEDVVNMGDGWKNQRSHLYNMVKKDGKIPQKQLVVSLPDDILVLDWARSKTFVVERKARKENY
ncbi:hypothetical protein K1719_020789 [Acacia pycnantha]|nr:hypothetical protein K1719_020789 [Acacia pycnantha]